MLVNHINNKNVYFLFETVPYLYIFNIIIFYYDLHSNETYYSKEQRITGVMMFAD